jgi:hypothetical protein
MKINKRKYYCTPKIDVVKLDRNIVLVAMSDPPPDPPGAVVPTGKDKPSFGPSSVAPSSTSNPFGGSSPDYGDM